MSLVFGYLVIGLIITVGLLIDHWDEIAGNLFNRIMMANSLIILGMLLWPSFLRECNWREAGE